MNGIAVLAALWAAFPLAGQQVFRRAGPEIPSLLPDKSEASKAGIDSELRRLGEDLDHPSYEVREQATRALMSAPFEILDFCALLAQSDLSPEQRYRLLTVLERRLVHEPHGALGISMERQQPNNPGPVVVADLVEGFPAEKVLRVGDRIAAIDGQTISSGTDLVVMVQLKRPGEEVRVKVERPQRDEQGNVLRDDDGHALVDHLTLMVELTSVRELMQRSGQRQVTELVRAARVDEAKKANLQYGPMPRLARIDLVEDSDAGGLAEAWSDPVESDPVIESLKRELERIRSGDLAVTDARRLRWQQQLRQLKLSALDPSVSEEDRDYARRLAQRYREMLPR